MEPENLLIMMSTTQPPRGSFLRSGKITLMMSSGWNSPKSIKFRMFMPIICFYRVLLNITKFPANKRLQLPTRNISPILFVLVFCWFLKFSLICFPKSVKLNFLTCFTGDFKPKLFVFLFYPQQWEWVPASCVLPSKRTSFDMKNSHEALHVFCPVKNWLKTISQQLSDLKATGWHLHTLLTHPFDFVLQLVIQWFITSSDQVCWLSVHSCACSKGTNRCVDGLTASIVNYISWHLYICVVKEQRQH